MREQFTQTSTDLDDRFWSKVNKTESCWLWTGSDATGGYGRMHIKGTSVYAHRIAFELHKGPIPAGLVIDHLCRNTICVNPDHLEAVTSKENILRGEGTGAQQARKTHCKRGHLLGAPDEFGQRSCSTPPC